MEVSNFIKKKRMEKKCNLDSSPSYEFEGEGTSPSDPSHSPHPRHPPLPFPHLEIINNTHNFNSLAILSLKLYIDLLHTQDICSFILTEQCSLVKKNYILECLCENN